MSTIKACLFDLDGVIVDTAVYHYKAWKQLANSLGFDFTEHQNEQLKGVSRVRSLELILGWGGVTKTAEEQEILATQKNTQYVEMISHMKPDEILPGAKQFVEACRRAGLKTALGSASKNSMMILEKIGMVDLFDAIIDGNKVSKAKPDPEVFLKGAEAVGVQPDECVVFEDAIAGIEAAIAGGMKSVGIGSPELLGRADLVVSGLSEMTLKMFHLFSWDKTIEKKYLIKPEVPGGLGENSILDHSTQPFIVNKLHYQFDDWLGDDIIESYPCYLCSENLSKAFQENKLTGFTLQNCEISKSELFMDLNPDDRELPMFYWLKINGNNQEDFFMSSERVLAISQRTLNILQQFNINYCDIEEYYG